MPKAPREPRKTPRQRRAVATCAAIVEAAARILEEGGVVSINTNLVAERAGVSIGTLYQYYPDKEAILVALVRRERESLLESLRTIAANSPTALEEMVELSIRHQFGRPRLAAALEVAETTLHLDAEATKMTREIAELSSELLVARFGQLDRVELLTAVIIGRAVINAAGEGQLPETALLDRVVNSVSGYLEKVRG
ncbi:TetR/AcrR family transcriptional regulator [Ciceribacter sp. L1K23]|uniref:TetR/AcrR family transcriptional regulator n=1 Tax=Ciceribacter sp. L1K23 TaxID=2820276 RepID=UPI001B81CB58|nr:TetR/AcrR family transcriptional regulator [Ciceribacter sp. L1K23]MBR0555538.1 TetR/AcrR family transcriptional regulator [Ciceribacter sp. L1K23]